MKIALLVSSNIVKDPRILKIADTINSEKHDLLVIGKYDEFATKERLENLTFHYKLINTIKSKRNLTMKVIGRLIFCYKMYKVTKKYSPDIIHTNDFDTLFFAILAKKATGSKLIYDAHEIYSKNGIKSKAISKLVEIIEKKLLKHVDTFITVSNAAKAYYISKKYSKEPVVITNAALSIFPISKIQNNENFSILYHGIMSEDRGYEEFFESYKYINSEIQLILRGYGPLKSLLIKQANDIGAKSVIFAEPVEIDELILKAMESHVGVVLTKPVCLNYEYTVSNKLFEYIHAGLPLILSPVKEHILLNEKYNFGIIVNEVNAIEIAKAINRLYNDKEFYEILRDNALEAAKVLNWETESLKLKEIYNSAQKNPG